MVSWTAKNRIRDVVLIGLLAGGGWYLWKNRAPAADGPMTCGEERAQILEKCQPMCEDAGPIKAVRTLAPAAERDDCIKECSIKYFRKHLPQC